ncbi:hypothetical protein ABZ297_26600 [Nonomuraea sp. NPDC005983]|uniref:hypothetical protein n=1 Tax=Nonomuraea sp. NPDC005983 TaxID=3155595 RepID=UPI0033AFE53F
MRSRRLSIYTSCTSPSNRYELPGRRAGAVVAELTAALGVRDSGSAVRAGLVHYNDRSDVDRLLEGVARLG